jgi:CRP-like cAMP-binding protein
MKKLLKCTDCAVGTCLLKKNLCSDDLRKVESEGYLMGISEGNAAFYSGGISNSLHILCAGIVALDFHLTPKHHQTVYIAKAGEVLSMGGLFGLKHSCTALTWSEVQVMEVKQDFFEDLAGRQPQLWANLNMMRTLRERALLEHMALWIELSVTERVAATLIVFHDIFGFNLTITGLRSRITGFAGVNMEQCARVLSNFKKNKVLSLSRSQIKVLQPEYLKQIAYARIA